MATKQTASNRVMMAMALVGVMLGAVGAPAAGQCTLTGRELRIVGSNSGTMASVVFDDGTGAAVYAGSSSSAGGVVVHRRALDGVWRRTAVAPGVSVGPVRTLLVDTDSQGAQSLLAGSSQLLRWSGSLQRWEAISPPAPRLIEAITRHTDASGSYLVASGSFGPQGVAWRLNGTVWERMGTTTRLDVQSLVSLDPDGPGSSPAILYAVGRGGTTTPTPGVLRWDGNEWQAVPGMNTWLKTATAFDDGTGPRLFVSGHLVSSPLVRNTHVARWTGSAWEGVDDRPGSPTQYEEAYGFALFDDGSGNGRELYAATSRTLVRLRHGQFSTVLAIAMTPSTSGGYLQHGLGVGRLALSGPEVLLIPQRGNVLAVTGCNACAADVNYDGVAAVTDVLQFINAWFAGLPEADFNRSGALSVDDVLAFISAWTGGC